MDDVFNPLCHDDALSLLGECCSQGKHGPWGYPLVSSLFMMLKRGKSRKDNIPLDDCYLAVIDAHMGVDAMSFMKMVA